ncbi:hypothetical protein AMAG_18706 [Allomyces macrogynus ATCC 38327]|uniref:Uncharacterized protein n=1 Tax=Allomyces macrogynus (strain ATCC 38327) TaxID=578462 RepID=A0A0L0SET0_ALLM3|nr:hypothetical protein AMAG_18706 [Allomyces macrogynus ATCC 38327]|eukprot:KNE60900.1 hypothetical protein AMAG_18706 [Allomyces macrogynus ATCC 38327]
MGELKKQRVTFTTLQEFLSEKYTQIGLVAGTARILELETTGYISMMPLIRVLKELVTENAEGARHESRGHRPRGGTGRQDAHGRYGQDRGGGRENQADQV